MINCKRCKSEKWVKNGIVRGKQRYKCKSCQCNFVQGDIRKDKNMDKQKLALHLYLENMGFRAIGRVLGVSNVTILNWVRNMGKFIQKYHQEQEKPSKVEVMELDELWHFIGEKKENYGFGLHWTEQGSVLLTLLSANAMLQRENGYGKKLKR
jgi:transposase-like protein